MEAIVYKRMAEMEGEHWWFTGRRAIIERLIADLTLPRHSARLLEVGCGTGGNLRLLQQFGSVDAVEADATARQFAKKRSGIDVLFGELPDKIDAPDQAYDLVALLDVLEHVEDDVGSLQTVAAKIKTDGHILITVPAHPWLWSSHDQVHHHKRRYTANSLRLAITEAGLRPRKIGYFNALLFPAAVTQRLVRRILGRDTSDESIPSALINQTLGCIFRAERHLIGRVPLPIGLSLYALAASH